MDQVLYEQGVGYDQESYIAEQQVLICVQRRHWICVQVTYRSVTRYSREGTSRRLERNEASRY